MSRLKITPLSLSFRWKLSLVSTRSSQAKTSFSNSQNSSCKCRGQNKFVYCLLGCPVWLFNFNPGCSARKAPGTCDTLPFGTTIWLVSGWNQSTLTVVDSLATRGHHLTKLAEWKSQVNTCQVKDLNSGLVSAELYCLMNNSCQSRDRSCCVAVRPLISLEFPWGTFNQLGTPGNRKHRIILQTRWWKGWKLERLDWMWLISFFSWEGCVTVTNQASLEPNSLLVIRHSDHKNKSTCPNLTLLPQDDPDDWEPSDICPK